jgi:hypothetical protein
LRCPPNKTPQGATVLLLCGGRELPARDLISTDEHKVDLGVTEDSQYFGFYASMKSAMH